MKDNHLQAVHDDDLLSLLTSLGVDSKVRNGECGCCFCKKTITFDNLGALIPLNGQIVFSCDEPACLNAMTKGEVECDGE